ncbi:MAG: ABC transporter permease [Hyphomicrobiaceae bacterium]
MLRLAVTKIGRAALTLLICLTMVYVVLRLSGDPASMLLPDDTPQSVLDEYRRRWGLDRPIAEQYLRYLAGLAQGHFGISFAESRPALDVVLERLPNTLLLGSLAIAAAVALGLPLGIVAALRHNTWVDRFVMSLAVLGFSLPTFFLAILLILLFSLHLRILPSAGSETWAHLIMPVTALGAGLMGKIARFARTAMLEVLGQPYIRTARAKGALPLAVIVAHALPNAAVPIVMFLGIEIGLILTGAVVTETIFAWPGLGRVLVTAAGQRDLPVVQAGILLIAFTIVVCNLAMDIVHAVIDPRAQALRGEPS